MAELAVKIPEEMITAAIQAQIIAAINEQTGPALIEAVVKQAMEEKTCSYGRGTKFGKACNAMIQEHAREIFKEWLAANQDTLRDALMKELNSRKQRHLKTMVEGICEQVAGSRVSIGLTFGND